MSERLFKNRTPEAAARQMAIVLVSLLESEMATLEGMRLLKSSPKYALNRHQQIVDRYVHQLHELDIPSDTRGLRGMPCPRVSAALASLEAS